MPDFTLRQLEYLVAVADAGSLVAAARRLHVTQPTVSDALSKLEQQFGFDLFVRHHARGVSLTPAGRRMLPDARNLLRHLDQFEHDALASASEVAGRLDLGCFVTLAPRYMPELIREFTVRHAGAQIGVREGLQEDLVDGVLTGRFDLALLYDIDLPPGVEIDVLSELRPHVLLPQDHALASQQRIALKSLRDEPFILFDVAPSRAYFTGVLRSAGIEPKVAFASPSFEMVRGLVGQGLGYSLLVTRPHSDRSYDGRPVITRPIRDRVRSSDVCLARRAGAQQTRLSRTFIEFCHEAIGPRGDRPIRRSANAMGR